MLPNECSLPHVSDRFWTKYVFVYETSDNTISKGLFNMFNGDLRKSSVKEPENSDIKSNSSVRSQESDSDVNKSISRVFNNDCQLLKLTSMQN